MAKSPRRPPAKSLSYSGYLALDRLLDCQKPESARRGRPAHDETLFIIVHQTYELWFKQILHELDSILALFGKTAVDEEDMGLAAARLARITEIQKILIDQLRVLETMTPLDFLEFRDLLNPSSGFQSVQFRLLENKLGLRADSRLEYSHCPYHVYVSAPEAARMVSAERAPSLFSLVERWLERTPFLDVGAYRFWDSYRAAVARMLDADAGVIRGNAVLSPQRRKAQLAKLAEARRHFDSLFDKRRHESLVKAGHRRLSQRALLAALFIHLYRDKPILQLPFKLLTLLVDVDELLTSWRYRHALMVRRMIGMKIGTGGSSGFGYLSETVERHKIFSDFFDLSTFLIPRSSLPKLPPDVERSLGFRYAPVGKP
ncbi:MAG TPA: tryptophan 2,3-dioxygenase family protein [Elusimicrobiota bacterium]|nr:tryptophan 2,3-dioxygenase family protein [Elusimicrobiota bacterium]